MSKYFNFLKYPRKDFDYRPIKERINDYKEIILRNNKTTIEEQGSRCMECGTPFCSLIGCPLGNLIPEWNNLIKQGLWYQAYQRMELTDNFPEFTGRICPAPCESACTLAINQSPTTIKQIELEIIERAFQEHWVKPYSAKRELSSHIAIIGSGPAGLAAAQELKHLGHQVTVYEKSLELGGLLYYGVPNFKLEKWVITRRIELLKAEGIQFKTNCYIGKDILLQDLINQYDAVLLACGTETAKDLPIKGRELQGIYLAMEYLSLVNSQLKEEKTPINPLNAKGKKVIVIGSGDTASDCIGTANRQKANSIIQTSRLAPLATKQEESNPNWPYSPKVNKITSSQEEGVKIIYNIQPKQFIGKNKIEAIEFIKTTWDYQQKRLIEIPNSLFTLECDLVLLAIGYLHVDHNPLIKELSLKITQQGNISVKNYQTSSSKVFATGDSVLGASLVVNAIADAKKSALAIHHYLKESIL